MHLQEAARYAGLVSCIGDMPCSGLSDSSAWHAGTLIYAFVCRIFKSLQDDAQYHAVAT